MGDRRAAGAVWRVALALLTLLGAPLLVAPSAAAESTSPAVVDFPDPFVVPVADGYVAYATASTGPADVAVARSSDLRSWEALTPTSAPSAPSAGDHGLWAPSVVQHGGVWRLYVSAPGEPGSGRCIETRVIPAPDRTVAGTAAATPVVCGAEGGDAIDPEVFVDRDGTAWLLWKSLLGGTGDGSARSTLWSQPLDASGTAVTGTPSALLSQAMAWEQPVIEAPSMVWWQDRYLLFYSGGTFVDQRYATGVAVCSSPAGPCARTSDLPVLASGPDHIGPGGASAFVDHRGRLRLAFHSWKTAATADGPRAVRTLEVGDVVGALPALRVVTGPFGSLDSVTATRGSLRVRGWAIDPQRIGPAVVLIEVDGVAVRSASSPAARPDVHAAYPGYGEGSGFELTVPVRAGAHVVCARFSGDAAACRAVRVPTARANRRS